MENEPFNENKMINLPRKLVYDEQPVLKNYLSGNELNKALYHVVLDVRNGQMRKGMFTRLFSERELWCETRSVDVFNHAYYLCILAANDLQFSRYFCRVERYGISYYASQMAIAILALQAEKTWNVRSFLHENENKLRHPFLSVVEKFRAQGRTFKMNFALRELKRESLEQVDWEKVTAGFDSKTIQRIIGFWNDDSDRRAVCERIWCAYRISPRNNMPYVGVDDSFFLGLLKNMKTTEITSVEEIHEEEVEVLPEKLTTSSSENYDWVRQVVDYAKNRHDWPEAKPISEMLNHLLRGKGDKALFDMVDEIELHFHQLKKRSDVNIDQAGNVFVNPQNVNNHG